MSGVDFLETLLDGANVDWIPLGDVVTFQRGKRLVKSQLEEVGSYAVFQNSMTPLGYYHENNVQGDTAFVIAAGAAGEIGYSDYEFWAADDVYFCLPSNKVRQKYLYHFLLMKKTEISSQVRRASIPRLSKAVIEKLEIPIPCPDNPKKSLEIQAEIVRILDTFTELTTELATELTTRKKQYNHYLDQVLSFEDGVPFKRLGDVVRIKNGKDHKSLGDGEFPVYGSGGVMRFADAFAYNKPSVLIPRKGSLGNLFFVDVPFWNVDTIFYTEIDEAQITPKFLYYFLITVGLSEMNQAGGVPSQTQSVLNELKIPLPTLNVQREIVAMLDKFDALTNSLTEGLPREIELRQKQYAHYRDLLLSFPYSKVVEA